MAKTHTKAAILGAGRVGAATAHHLALRGICDELVLVDIDQNRAWSEAADLQHSVAFLGRPVEIRAGSYYDCADADICVLATATHPGQDRSMADVVALGSERIGRMVPSVMATGFEGVFLVLSNPVCMMTWLVQQLSGLPDESVVGMGTTLECVRLRQYLSELLRTEPRHITAWVLGEHQGEQMIPWSLLKAAGADPEALAALDGTAVGNTVAELSYTLNTVKGASVFGKAAVAAELVDVILHDRRETLPVATMLHGEYGEEDVCIGVPAVVGRRGVLAVPELELNAMERSEFARVAKAIRHAQAEMG